MAAGVARAHPWRQRIFLVAFGREHGIVDVVIAIRPERIVVCVRPQRVVEEIAVGVGPEQRAGPADVAVAESAALERVERCGGAQVGMREGARRCRIAASCFATPRGLSKPPSRRRASETLAMRYCGRAAQRSVSSAIRSGTRFMPRECAHAAGVDAAMRNGNVTGARSRVRSSEVHTRAAARMSAAEVWPCRKMRQRRRPDVRHRRCGAPPPGPHEMRRHHRRHSAASGCPPPPGCPPDRHGDRQLRAPQPRQALFPPRLLRLRLSTWSCSV